MKAQSRLVVTYLKGRVPPSPGKREIFAHGHMNMYAALQHHHLLCLEWGCKDIQEAFLMRDQGLQEISSESHSSVSEAIWL